MKLKYYLNGFGIGIIFATLVLMISFYSRKGDTEHISKQEVESLALSYGMVYPEETTEVETTEEQSDTAKEIESTKEQNTEETIEGLDTTIKGSEEQDIVGYNNTLIKETKITVASGMYASTIAELLEETGVIENAQEFSLYLMQQGYTKKLQAGVYTFTEGMDFATIAGKLLWETEE